MWKVVFVLGINDFFKKNYSQFYGIVFSRCVLRDFIIKCFLKCVCVCVKTMGNSKNFSKDDTVESSQKAEHVI